MARVSKSWYMHTIDGKPAFYAERNEQICYAMRRQNFPILVEDLATIREQQRKTIDYRMRQRCDVDPGEYGYITFPKVPVKRAATKRQRSSAVATVGAQRKK